MHFLSLIIGLLSFAVMLVALIPCLGAINWLNIPLAVIGLVLGLVSMSKGKTKGLAIAGVILCSLSAAIGTIRLIVGFGVF